MGKDETWDWQSHINIDPAIQSGHPVIRGTRVPVEVLVGSLAGGDSIKDVCEGYHVTEEDVRAALAYAATLVGKQRARAVPGR